MSAGYKGLKTLAGRAAAGRGIPPIGRAGGPALVEARQHDRHWDCVRHHRVNSPAKATVAATHVPTRSRLATAARCLFLISALDLLVCKKPAAEGARHSSGFRAMQACASQLHGHAGLNCQI